LPHSTWAGHAHLQLGIALAGDGQTASARRELQQAVDQLRGSVGPEAPATRQAVARLGGLDS
jgi:hypothetical protein